MILLAIAVSAVIQFLPVNPDHFRHQESIIWVLLVAAFSWILTDGFRYRWLLSGSIFYFAANAIRIFGTKSSPFGSFAPQFDGPAAAFLLLLLLQCFMVRGKSSRVFLRMGFTCLALMDAVAIWFHLPLILDVLSGDSAFLAVLLPGFLFAGDFWCSAFLSLTIVHAHGSAGLLALMPIAMVYCYRRWGFWAILSAAAIIGIGYWTQETSLFDGSGRSESWAVFLEAWKQKANLFLGFGPGTFQVLGYQLQKDHGIKNLYLYAHNEAVQILFENGIIGLALTLLIIIVAAHLSRRKPELIATLGALFVVSMAHSPLRYAIFSLYAALTIADAFDLDAVEQSS